MSNQIDLSLNPERLLNKGIALTTELGTEVEMTVVGLGLDGMTNRVTNLMVAFGEVNYGFPESCIMMYASDAIGDDYATATRDRFAASPAQALRTGTVVMFQGERTWRNLRIARIAEA